MSVEEETNALGGVTEDISIAERVEVVIQKYVTLSIIGGYYSTAAWHMGPLADVQWITSDEKFAGIRKRQYHGG